MTDWKPPASLAPVCIMACRFCKVRSLASLDTLLCNADIWLNCSAARLVTCRVAPATSPSAPVEVSIVPRKLSAALLELPFRGFRVISNCVAPGGHVFPGNLATCISPVAGGPAAGFHQFFTGIPNGIPNSATGIVLIDGRRHALSSSVLNTADSAGVQDFLVLLDLRS